MLSIQRTYVSIPTIFFPVLSALAANFIFGHMSKSGLINKMSAACPENLNPDFPFRLTYTGIHFLDNILCMLGAFFAQNFDPELSPFFLYFTASGFLVNVFPGIEARRLGHSSWLSHTLILGFFNKSTSVAIAMPIYWLILILTGSAKAPVRRTGERNIVTRSDVETVIFGIVVGNVIPSAVMLLTHHPRSIALWQFYPIYIALSQKFYKFIRPRSLSGAESGHTMLRNFYSSLFILAATSHVYYVWPKFGDSAALKLFFLPSLHALPPETTSFAAGASDFMKWDFVIGFLSSVLVTLWFARNIRELLFFLGWHLMAVPLVGPSAAVLGAVIWRESVMNMFADRVVWGARK